MNAAKSVNQVNARRTALFRFEKYIALYYIKLFIVR